MIDSVIYKYPIPVDDERHPIPWVEGRTRITHVQVRDDPSMVDVWVFHEGGLPTVTGIQLLRVVGTGQWFQDTAVVEGTTVHPETKLVWHVIRLNV
jgi:hypothetical protein